MTLNLICRNDEYLVNMQHTVIPSWYQREGYIKAMANLIEKELQKFDNPDKVGSWYVLCLYHYWAFSIYYLLGLSILQILVHTIKLILTNQKAGISSPALSCFPVSASLFLLR